MGRYGEHYAQGPTATRAKAGAQDAHEAIRPSNVNWTPEQLKKDLTGEQYRLYRLVWSRFVASQMANAVYDSVAVEIEAGTAFRATSSSLKFSALPPCTRRARTRRRRKKESPCPLCGRGETVTLKGLFSRTSTSPSPPPTIPMQLLIRAMEEQGIGRPSTYAPTVSTILDREYVMKEDGKYLHITNLGRVVTALMKDKFSRHRGHEVHRQHGGEAGLHGRRETPWKGVLREFCRDFEEPPEAGAEKDLDGPVSRCPTRSARRICRVRAEPGGQIRPVRSLLACPGSGAASPCRWWWRCRAAAPKCGGRLMKAHRQQQEDRQAVYLLLL